MSSGADVSMERPLPRPTPLSALPPPPPPLPAAPSPLRVASLVTDAGPELAVIFKTTYDFQHGSPPRAAGEQPPLDDAGETYEPLAPDSEPSFRSLPEAIGFKTGSDVVIRGAATASRPVTSMRVGVQVRDVRHEADVIGRRVCRLRHGRIEFSEPEPFERMPLRYELAYGGRDLWYEAAFMAELRRTAAPESMRRAGPVLKHLFGTINPFMYPRNRFGKGYILSDAAEAVEGRELPNIERPDDRITPDRIVLDDPFGWASMPVPIGFDYFDPLSFPRCAMLGMPPDAGEQATPAEVRMGLIPPDYCRGHVLTAEGAAMADVIHPCASRVASLGLWLPFLAPGEPIYLWGMVPDLPYLQVDLPAAAPAFLLEDPHVERSRMDCELHLVHIDVDARRLTLVWVGRSPLRRPLELGQAAELAGRLRLAPRTRAGAA